MQYKEENLHLTFPIAVVLVDRRVSVLAVEPVEAVYVLLGAIDGGQGAVLHHHGHQDEIL